MATTYLWLHNRKRFLTATTANTTTKFGWIDKCRNHNRDQGNHPTWQPQYLMIYSYNYHYYSTIMSFYQIRSRERTKYEAVIHCSVLV